NNQVVAIGNYSIGNQQIMDIVMNYYTGIPPTNPVQCFIADNLHGFLKYEWDAIPIVIDGTKGKLVSRVKAYNGKIVVAPSLIDETGTPNFYLEGLYFFDGEKWNYLRDYNHDTIVDLTDAIIDPKDDSHIYAVSWINGIVEYKNNQLFKVSNQSNTGLVNAAAVGLNWHLLSGITMDPSGNIWVNHPITPYPFSVLKPNGQVINLSMPGYNAIFTSRILYDRNNQVWSLLPRGNGIIIYKNNNLSPMNSSNTKYLTSTKGNGGLPSDYVWSIAEDKNGYIWLGTSQGVAVIYNPENIFNGGNYDAQQIYITQDGQTQLLLVTEKVTAIAVDSANRKWIGTEASGLFCFSSDGQTQIFHFTNDNSPLLSNNIIDIAYDDKTGDIIVATDKGIQSYRTDVIGGFEDYSTVHVFPNPVKYSNENVYIKGLIDGSIAKITDLAGHLVWEGKSNGGMITWNLQSLFNKRVTEGIYIVYATTSDGQQKAVSKIMVINSQQ
ncbi:MAG: T9SS type A sorting domain-containing protein, partial [Spirochaetes bacterium]|nr:T9SS type A sorting domain-containing protein [Spirochaetota bacterium]